MAQELLIRRAEIDDVVSFNALVSSLGRVPLFRAIFGAFNYSNIVEYSHLSLIASCGSDAEAVGFVSITDTSTLDSLTFDGAIKELKQYVQVEITNTLFINFWAVEEKTKNYNGDIGVDLVKKIFTTCPEIDFLVWLCPVSVKQTDYMQRVFEEIETEGTESRTNQSVLKGTRLLILRRESYLLRLSVREARVEDNDDLLPILIRSNPALIDGQEKYFLANLIQTRDESNRFYVGMNKNKLVGMLATSTDVNVSLIKKVFDIDVFADIILRKETKPRPAIKKIALVGNIQYLEESAISDLAAQLNSVYVDAGVSLSQPNSSGSSADEDEGNVGNVDTNDINTAMVTLRRLNTLISDKCNEYIHDHDGTLPIACIITGFPRTEAEVGAILNHPGIVDIVIEVGRILSDAAEAQHELDVEENPAVQSHMDAADMLRMMIFSDEEVAGAFRRHAQWIKLPDVGDVLTLLTHEMYGTIARIEVDLQEFLIDNDGDDKYYSNAFAVTLFCTEEGSETRAIDMLRVAFEDATGLDYCLCMVPNSSPVMPLVELMVPVKVRPGMSFNQSLYVMRKESFLAKENLTVERLTDELLPELSRFLNPLVDVKDKEVAMTAAKRSLQYNDAGLNDNPMEVSFVLLFHTEVVGFVTLSRRDVTNEDVSKLRAAYRLDDIVDYERYRSRSQAVITHWIQSPIFSRWSKFIIREIMRQYEKTLLYYQGVSGASPATEIVDELISVAPRKAMQEINRMKGKEKGKDNRKDRGPLYIITRNKLSQKKTTINSRIVIVGGTSYAHAVLETFCFIPQLIFSNIYIVNDRASTPFLLENFGRTTPDNNNPDNMFGTEFSGCLSVRDVDDPNQKDMYSLGLAYKSTLVRGHLTDIDRENKTIVVSDEVALEYDMLLIASPSQDTTVRSFPATRGMHPATCMERGIFGLGNPHADEQALRWVLKYSLGASSDMNDTQSIGSQSKIGGAVVVFGSGIDALAAIGGLIKNSVPPTLISLVIPETELEEMGHSTINESVYLALHDCGVEIYAGHIVIDVVLNSHHFLQGIKLENKMFEVKSSQPTGPIGGVDFDDNSSMGVDRPPPDCTPQFVTIDCSTLLCCLRKSCDSDVFSAINESGLVYDGGVVVDERFRTVDPAIYAIGSYTRFSRVYRDVVPHFRFNAREVGHFAGKQMIETLLSPRPFERKAIPTSGSRVRLPPPAPPSSLPTFALPRTVCATLPGSSTLLHSSVPQLVASLENQPLVTGEPGMEKLCMLKLDYLGCAVELVYVGTAAIEEQNLGCIVGLHESYLGSALFSYERGLVQHWTDFFRGGYFDVVYHDRLSELIGELRGVVMGDRGMLTVLDKVFDIAATTDDDQVVGAARKKIEGDKCCDVDHLTKMIIEAKSLDFLKKNKSSLLTFFIPPVPNNQAEIVV